MSQKLIDNVTNANLYVTELISENIGNNKFCSLLYDIKEHLMAAELKILNLVESGDINQGPAIRGWADGNGWRWLWDGKNMWVENQYMDWKISEQWPNVEILVEDRIKKKINFGEVSPERALKFMFMKNVCVGAQ